jgi:hypothetical protein
LVDRFFSFLSKGGNLDFLFFNVRYSTLIHRPPLRFHGVGGSWRITGGWLSDSLWMVCEWLMDDWRITGGWMIEGLPVDR